MKTLTVFTPAYNRTHTLRRTYESLCRQTCRDFEWLIIDDGSTDGTRALVRSWLKCGRDVHGEDGTFTEHPDGFSGYSLDAPWLHIRYSYKDNGGLHTAYNKAAELLLTELCVCIDSDDFMPDNAVEIIITKWEQYNNGHIAGLIGSDYLLNGNRLGAELPEGKIMRCVELERNRKFRFDKKIVMRADLMRRFTPQPSYKGEKNFNPIYIIMQVDQIAPFALINENLCFVDYQESGMAANIYKQYVNSPNSFCALRCLNISLKHTSIAFKLRNLLHLASESIIAHDLSWLNRCKYSISAHLILPLGWLLSRYIIYKSSK